MNDNYCYHETGDCEHAYTITMPLTITVTMDEMNCSGEASGEIALGLVIDQIQAHFGDASIKPYEAGDDWTMDELPSIKKGWKCSA